MNHLWFVVTLALVVAHRITLLTTLLLKPQTLRLPSIFRGHCNSLLILDSPLCGHGTFEAPLDMRLVLGR